MEKVQILHLLKLANENFSYFYNLCQQDSLFYKMFTPIRYIPPIYRPPSEAQSLILPATDGCSWNRCTFCEMYQTKKFKARKEEEVLGNIRYAATLYGTNIRRVFLADGDALVLPTRRLLNILHAIKNEMPWVARVSSYCLPRNLNKKSLTELKELKDAGLKLAYIGAESGDDEVLNFIQKGETFESTVAALQKLGDAGITRSVMILNGLGGKALSAQHAENSARLANAINPEFLAVLVVSFPEGDARLKNNFPGWQMLSPLELLSEMAQFVGALNLKNTIFRSDHASNYLALKGVLNRDKSALLKAIAAAQNHPEILRAEWQRGI